MSDENRFLPFVEFDEEGKLCRVEEQANLEQYFADLARELRLKADELEPDSDSSRCYADVYQTCAKQFELLSSCKRRFANSRSRCQEIIDRAVQHAEEQAEALRTLLDQGRELCDLSIDTSELTNPILWSMLSDHVDNIRETDSFLRDMSNFAIDLSRDYDEFIEHLWNTSLSYQRFIIAPASEAMAVGSKMLRNIESARKLQRSPVELTDIERKLDELRRKHARLSKTQLRKFAAEELGISLRTLLRRLNEKNQ